MCAAFVDVSLPVPLSQAFTYRVPETMQHRVQPGCRLLVPFAGRKLVGVALRVHDQPPPVDPKPALRLVDEEPVLDAHMLQLAEWMADYYCAPLGEVLRSMAPAAAELRRTVVFGLTDAGLAAVRQLSIAPDQDTAAQLLLLLQSRPRSAEYLTRKLPGAKRALLVLERKGWITREEVQTARDPLRASSRRLLIRFLQRPEANARLSKPVRELISYLELHPGFHRLADLESKVRQAGRAGRALARLGLVELILERPVSESFITATAHRLTASQQAAFEAILQAIQSQQYQAFLLYGVTGSGKTEVYLRAIESALALGYGALLLVPEIALTPAVAGQFYGRFGDRVAILHSAFNDIERAEHWRRIRAGEAKVVVGTRSAVFAPVQNLRLLIVDEEHDQSYKQQETPRYHARDVAVKRAHSLNAVVVLGSATPSLESRFNVERGKYQLLRLPERIARRPLPAVQLVDMRVEFLETGRQSSFSRVLLDALRERLASGEQAILLHNRRGFSTFVACRCCGERMMCAYCSVTLTYHRRDRRMLCHYCNYATQVPQSCLSCGSEHIYFIGVGAERVEDELHREFPQARIARLDRDAVAGKHRLEAILQGFRDHQFDFLVGTQMIAKGHDIPNVTLVGIISADLSLGIPDFRAAERTFQLLTQAAGRAGRGDLPGQVIIQTLAPEHYAIRYAAAQDYEGFYAKELEFRRALFYPPFSAMASVLVRDPQQEHAACMAAELGRLLMPPPPQIKVHGPAAAPVERIQGDFRYQLLLKSANRPLLKSTLERLRQYAQQRSWPPAALTVDVDPLHLL